ncbi:hypothetical protein REPUB_Repub16aG0099100 [Reevesia pubescens]
MEEDGIAEESFTGFATKALGRHFGAFVAVIYASLSFSLLVACVSGIGLIVCQWFPWMNLVSAHALFPLAVGTVIMFFPFKAIDVTNRLLCFLMLFSISALVAIGLCVARPNVIVRGFAFSALATSLTGYAVSFPKQLLDTLDLILGKTSLEKQNSDGSGKVGFLIYSDQQDRGNFGKVSFRSNIASEDEQLLRMTHLKSFEMFEILGKSP